MKISISITSRCNVGIMAIQLLISNLVFANSIPYPTQIVDRPLVLPRGLAEVAINLGKINWTSTDDGLNNTTTTLNLKPVTLKYGITHQMQLQNAGLVYRFIDKPIIESVVFGEIENLVYHSHGGANIDYSIGLLAKHRLNRTMAVSYQLQNKYKLNSSANDEDILGITIFTDYAFSRKLAISAGAKYEKWKVVNNLRMTNTGIVLTLYQNVYSNLDLRYSVEISRNQDDDLSRNDFDTGKFTVDMTWRWGKTSLFP